MSTNRKLLPAQIEISGKVIVKVHVRGIRLQPMISGYMWCVPIGQYFDFVIDCYARFADGMLTVPIYIYASCETFLDSLSA